MKLTKLASCPGALHNLGVEAEADAEKFLDDLEAARTYKNTTFTRAASSVMDLRGQLGDFNDTISALDAVASNGGPTSGEASPASPPSSPALPPSAPAAPAPAAAPDPKPRFENTALGPMATGR